MRSLVLGAAGQIGSALVSHLRDQGHAVLEFDLVRSGAEDLRQHGNPRLEELMRQCDFVYFLAFDVGGAVYLKKYQMTYEFLSNNVKIMNTTFDMLRAYNKPFVFASSQMSNMAYSSYGVLKSVGEYYTRILGGIVSKFWNVYGVEQDATKAHVITDFVRKAKDGRMVDMLTDGTEERQFLFARDASEALLYFGEHYDQIPRDRELHVTSFEWVSILRVAHLVAGFFEGTTVVPGAQQDGVQRDKRNEPDPFVLNYWRPRTVLADGIRCVIDAMKGPEQYPTMNHARYRA